jgi:hypothetical protein
MLAGCNLGMALSTQSLDHVAARRSTLMLRFAACSTGMILGMLFAPALLPSPDAGVAGVPAPIRMFLVMILGMTAGMWGGWWFAKWVLNRRTRWAASAASRQSPLVRD